MKWIVLGIGIIFEVLGTVCMEKADGFTKLIPSILVFVFYGISLAALVMVLKKMEVSIAYAIWASAGILIMALVGIFVLHEPVSWIKIISMLLIILGVIGLEFFD